jgi:hypothetical protein
LGWPPYIPGCICDYILLFHFRLNVFLPLFVVKTKLTRRLCTPLKKLLDEAETGLSRTISWRMRMILFQAWSRPIATGRMTRTERRWDLQQDAFSGHGNVYLQPEFQSTSDAVMNTKLMQRSYFIIILTYLHFNDRLYLTPASIILGLKKVWVLSGNYLHS